MQYQFMFLWKSSLVQNTARSIQENVTWECASESISFRNLSQPKF